MTSAEREKLHTAVATAGILGVGMLVVLFGGSWFKKHLDGITIVEPAGVVRHVISRECKHGVVVHTITVAFEDGKAKTTSTYNYVVGDRFFESGPACPPSE